MAQIQTRLLKQLQMDMEESEKILQKKPELIYRITEKQPAFSVQDKSSPEIILKTLQNKLQKDFPTPPETDVYKRQV